MTDTSTTTSIVAISRHGAELARRLADCLEGPVELHIAHRFHQQGGVETPFDLPARPVIQKLFTEARRLVLFMPVGAAVRLLAPSLRDKRADPAVVCVDDGGRFAVSLVSGHLGGADQLAQEVAEALGATPVVTSASHVMGVFAVDLLGRDLGWTIEAQPGQLTRASAAVVNGEAVGLFQDAGELDLRPEDQELPENVTRYSSVDAVMESSCVAALLITDRSLSAFVHDETDDKAVVIYRPKTLVAGMGCRRGVPADELEGLLTSAFDANGLALGSLSCIATAELKRDEPGIVALAQKYDVPVRCYSADELNSVFEETPQPAVDAGEEIPPDLRLNDEAGGTGQTREAKLAPTARPRVHELLGIWGVAEPAALLAAGSRELLVARIKSNRATIAITRVAFGNGE